MPPTKMSSKNLLLTNFPQYAFPIYPLTKFSQQISSTYLPHIFSIQIFLTNPSDKYGQQICPINFPPRKMSSTNLPITNFPLHNYPICPLYKFSPQIPYTFTPHITYKFFPQIPFTSMPNKFAPYKNEIYKFSP